MEIWLRQNGEEYGPYTLVQIKQYIASGEVTLEDEAWFYGCDDYLTVADIPGLNSTRKIPAKRPPTKGKKSLRIIAAICGGLASIGITTLILFKLFFNNSDGADDRSDDVPLGNENSASVQTTKTLNPFENELLLIEGVPQKLTDYDWMWDDNQRKYRGRSRFLNFVGNTSGDGWGYVTLKLVTLDDIDSYNLVETYVKSGHVPRQLARMGKFKKKSWLG